MTTTWQNFSIGSHPRIPKHPTLNETFLTLEETATKSLSSGMIFPNLNIRGDGTTAR